MNNKDCLHPPLAHRQSVITKGRKLNACAVERGVARVETGRKKVEKGLYRVERGITRGNKSIAHTSFSYDDLGVSMVTFQLTAKAMDILFKKLRISSVICPPDAVG